MRTKAPGAATFPQVVKSRFGTVVHLIMVVNFLLTAVVSLMMIVFNGGTILAATTEDSSFEKLITCIFISIAACVVFIEFGNFHQTLYLVFIFLLLMVATLGLSMFNDSRNFPLVGVMRCFLCQGNWVSGIDLPLDHSSLSFALAALAIFSVPFLYAVCLGLGYVALQSAMNETLSRGCKWTPGKFLAI
ncbi:unnamed protein product [Dibothriocephalus latus]|uniref:Uncharacterized protein n=1 Tax=Dibothriocephalus latus TaxID=60516 RepID=A0A3P6SPI4_DIBLA|nr:unnamed protein product [Dibothriocephalus latus]